MSYREAYEHTKQSLDYAQQVFTLLAIESDEAKVRDYAAKSVALLEKSKENGERLAAVTSNADAAIEQIAQLAHQAYHLDIPVSWRACPKDLCRRAQEAIER